MAKQQTGKPFGALYYPYSRLSETDLKRAILIFDEILFVDHLSNEITELPGQYPIFSPQLSIRNGGDNPTSTFSERAIASFSWAEELDLKAWYSISATYKLLNQHGSAKLIDPRQYLKYHQEILTYSILRDYCKNLHPHMGLFRHTPDCDMWAGEFILTEYHNR